MPDFLATGMTNYPDELLASVDMKNRSRKVLIPEKKVLVDYFKQAIPN